MACACPSQGATTVYLTKAGPAPYDFTGATTGRLLVESFGLIADEELHVDEASDGNRDTNTSRGRNGIEHVAGPITVRPSFNDLTDGTGQNGNKLALKILGGNGGSGINVPAAALPSWATFVATAAAQMQFEDLKVRSAEFVAESGQTLQLILDLIGKTKSLPAITVPSIAIGVTPEDLPLVFHYATLLLGGVDYCFSRFRLRIENTIEDLFYNSKNATCLDEGQLRVTGQFELPWNSDVATALYGHGQDGLAASIKFLTAPADSYLTIALAAVKWPNRTPKIPDQKAIQFPLEFKSFATASNPSVKFTHTVV